jgi:hypothetical protein
VSAQGGPGKGGGRQIVGRPLAISPGTSAHLAKTASICGECGQPLTEPMLRPRWRRPATLQATLETTVVLTAEVPGLYYG